MYIYREFFNNLNPKHKKNKMQNGENFNKGIENTVEVAVHTHTHTHTHTYKPAIFLATVVVNMARPMHCVSASALMQKSICRCACVCECERKRGKEGESV